MLRNLLQQRSWQLLCFDTAAAQCAGGVPGQHAISSLTCLRRFSSPPGEGGDPPPAASPPAPSAEAEAGAGDPAAAASPSAALLQNAKLWRQWVEGKLDEKKGADGRPPPAQAAKMRISSRLAWDPASTAFGGPGSGTDRPKDSSRDWKAAARTSRRPSPGTSAEDRIAAIIVPQDTPVQHKGGQYGWLGGAYDAPKFIPGAAAKAEDMSPQRLLPHRLFYPGQTYLPQDLDPYKAKDVPLKQDLSARRMPISPMEVVEKADFRNVQFLSLFVSEAGKIVPRRRLRLPAKVHRELTRQIKLARVMGLMHPTQRRAPFKQRRPPPSQQGPQGHSAPPAQRGPQHGQQRQQQQR